MFAVYCIEAEVTLLANCCCLKSCKCIVQIVHLLLRRHIRDFPGISRGLRDLYHPPTWTNKHTMADRVRRPAAPRLDEGAKNYYRRVEEALESGGDGEEVLFLRNVVDQVISDGLRLVSCDKDGSRALERLVQHFSMNNESLLKLLRAAEADFFKLCVNRCGSHVVQSLLQASSHALSRSNQDPEQEQLLELFLSLTKVLEEKVSDCVSHPYASHVMSGLIQELGGVRLSDQKGRSRYSREFRKVKMAGVSARKSGAAVQNVPDSFLKRLESIAKKVCKLKELGELLTHQNGSPVIQCLLRVVCQRLPVRGEKLIKKLLKLSRVLGGGTDEGSSLPELFMDQVGSHVTEAMICVAPPHLHQLIFTTCFKGHVMPSALHPTANFPLQHLIAAADPALVSAARSSFLALLPLGHSSCLKSLKSCSHWRMFSVLATLALW